MKKLNLTLSSVLSLLLSLSGLQAQPCADSLNIYTFTYQGRTYEVVKEKKDWEDAADCAEERGGYLVHLGSQQEQDSVYHAIVIGAGVAANYVSVPDGGGVAYVWIGAHDKLTEGSWIWDGDNDGTGTAFWTGQGAAGAGGGMAIGGAFVNWGGTSTGVVKEPDDYGSNQDGAAIALNGWPGGSGALGIAGEWNDLAVTNELYFVIEYDVNTALEETVPLHPEIKIFPQPASDFVTVKLNTPSGNKATLDIYFPDGRKVFSSDLSSDGICHLDICSWSRGVYYVMISTSDGYKLSKLLLVE